MSATQAVGRYGESVAATRLSTQGWTILDRNWRCEIGEIDLVAVDGDTLVIVEVKTRRGNSAGAPQEAVTASKVARLRRLVWAWLAHHEGGWPQVRIDVIAITVPRSGPVQLEHLKAVG